MKKRSDSRIAQSNGVALRSVNFANPRLDSPAPPSASSYSSESTYPSEAPLPSGWGDATPRHTTASSRLTANDSPFILGGSSSRPAPS
eukprot:scaffold2136_cov242-Pinguiococcus_pyrenoidosus.AAC.1